MFKSISFVGHDKNTSAATGKAKYPTDIWQISASLSCCESRPGATAISVSHRLATALRRIAGSDAAAMCYAWNWQTADVDAARTFLERLQVPWSKTTRIWHTDSRPVSHPPWCVLSLMMDSPTCQVSGVAEACVTASDREALADERPPELIRRMYIRIFVPFHECFRLLTTKASCIPRIFWY